MGEDNRLPEDCYGTRDWNEIVFLIQAGFQPSDTRRWSPRSVEFIFDDKKKCVEKVMEMKSDATDEASIVKRTLDAIREARTKVRETPSNEDV